MSWLVTPGRLRRLAGDETGTSILELALCAPLLVIFLVGIIDLAMYGAARLKVTQSVFRGIEIVQVNTSAQAIATVKSEVAASAGYGVTSASVTVGQDLYCDGAKQASYTGACAAGAAIARYLTISAAGTYTPLMPSMTSRFFSNRTVSGDVPFTGSAAVRVQ